MSEFPEFYKKLVLSKASGITPALIPVFDDENIFNIRGREGPPSASSYAAFLDEYSSVDPNTNLGYRNVVPLPFGASLPSSGDGTLVWNVGSTTAGGGGTIKIRAAHLSETSTAELVGSTGALSYGTNDKGGFSIWASTGKCNTDSKAEDDCTGGYEEWIYVPAELSSEGEIQVARYEIMSSAEFVMSEKLGLRVVTKGDGLLWMGVEAPEGYTSVNSRAVKVPVKLSVVEGGKAIVAYATISKDLAGYPLLIDPVWTLSDDTTLGRSIHTATRLLDGRVLIAGGIDETYQVTNTAEIYDPLDRSWTTVAPMPSAIRSHAQALLHDGTGRVLITHGVGGSIGRNAFLYDPTTDMWTPADPTRSQIGNVFLGQRSVSLPNGQVMLTGNHCCTGRECHIYDPTTDTFYPCQSMIKHRLQHTLTVLNDGTVLAAGGGTLNPTSLISNTAELFIPNTNSANPYVDGSWMSLPNMTSGHFDHDAVLLTSGPNFGNVLICSGADGSTYPGSYFFTSICDIYNSTDETFFRTASIPRLRQRSGTGNGGDFLALIESGPSAGNVVAAGGYPATYATDVFNVTTMTWNIECNLLQSRLRHQTVPLMDGSIAVFGGQQYPNAQSTRNVEILHFTDNDDDCDGIPNSLDVCPLGGCGVVTGLVYGDTDEDCTFGTAETGTSNVMIRAEKQITGELRYGFTNKNGGFHLDLPAGYWDVSLVESINAQEICNAPKMYSVNALGGTSGLDFQLKSVCGGTLTMTSTGSLNGTECNGFPYRTPCPGSNWRYCFTMIHGGNVPWKSIDFTFAVPAGMTFFNYHEPTGQNGCGFTVVSSPPAGPISIQLNPQGNSNALDGGNACTVCFDVAVNSIPPGGWTAIGTLSATGPPGLDCTIDLSYNETETDACGCDPNDKMVLPEGCDEVGTYPGGRLGYTVRFQNTGEGPAKDIAIVDPIDPDLDLETMALTGTSHNPTEVQVGEGGTLFMRFDGIDLPAAKNDYFKSQGCIKYDIDPDALATTGDVFTNKADIFFDQQEEVVTNEVINTIGDCPLLPKSSSSKSSSKSSKSPSKSSSSQDVPVTVSNKSTNNP